MNQPHENEAMRRFNTAVLQARDILINEGARSDPLHFHTGMFHSPEEPFVILGPVCEHNREVIAENLKMVPYSWHVEYTTHELETVLRAS